MVTIQKWGNSTFQVSFSKVCMPVTQEALKISECPFRYWVLTNFPFGIFIFKALYGSVPEILEFQNGSRSKSLKCTHFQWLKTKCGSVCKNMILHFF